MAKKLIIILFQFPAKVRGATANHLWTPRALMSTLIRLRLIFSTMFPPTSRSLASSRVHPTMKMSPPKSHQNRKNIETNKSSQLLMKSSTNTTTSQRLRFSFILNSVRILSQTVKLTTKNRIAFQASSLMPEVSPWTPTPLRIITRSWTMSAKTSKLCIRQEATADTQIEMKV